MLINLIRLFQKRSDFLYSNGLYVLAGILGFLVSSPFCAQNICAQSVSADSELPATSMDYRQNINQDDVLSAYATPMPVIALKTNLLYDLTTTINLDVELGLAFRWTLNIPVNYNPWKFGDTRIRHLGVQPEVRYWFCSRFDGWFMGLHGHYAKFNVGGLPDWAFISKNMQLNRYQGYLYGGGVSVGYSWILKKRWSLEATIGAGYAHIVYDKYPCAECGNSMGRKTKDYFGITKLGLSLVYMIK